MYRENDDVDWHSNMETMPVKEFLKSLDSDEDDKEPVSDPIEDALGFLKGSKFSTERYFQMKQEDKELEFANDMRRMRFNKK